MNIASAGSAGLAPAEGDSGQARGGLKQSWMKSLEQAWREAPRGEAPQRGRDRVMGGGEAPEPGPNRTVVAAWQQPEQPLARQTAMPGEAAAIAPQGTAALAGAGPAGARPVGRATAALCAPALQPVPQQLAPPAAGGPLRDVPELPGTGEPARPPRAPQEPLAPRSLLTLPEGDGLAVWVRDGALAAPDAARLADGLRRAARELGVNLRRVAVNGRTAYEVADTSSPRLTEARR